jgi:alpha-L-fucosidase 2
LTSPIRNQDARDHIPELQSLIREGRVLEAQRLAGYVYTGQPLSTRHYEPLGELELSMNHTAAADSYERYNDVDDSTVGVFYVKNGTAYRREYISSYPDDIVAIHISSNVSGAVSFQVHLRRGEAPSLNRWEDYSAHVNDNTVVMDVHSAASTGIKAAAGAKVISSGGKVYTLGDTILCDGADEATIYFTAWTEVRKRDPRAAVMSQLATMTKLYNNIRKAHVSDYQKLAHRVSLSFGNSTKDQKSMTTAQRVGGLTNGTLDPELVALYFQFGRYLLLSSSRQGTLPTNLQGMWNFNPDPYWGSKYTTNINLQMNYWPALVTNLKEVLPPLHSLIGNIQTQGASVAKQMYGAGGFVCHHNTDLWGDAAPQDNYAARYQVPNVSLVLVH